MSSRQATTGLPQCWRKSARERPISSAAATLPPGLLMRTTTALTAGSAAAAINFSWNAATGFSPSEYAPTRLRFSSRPSTSRTAIFSLPGGHEGGKADFLERSRVRDGVERGVHLRRHRRAHRDVDVALRVDFHRRQTAAAGRQQSEHTPAQPQCASHGGHPPARPGKIRKPANTAKMLSAIGPALLMAAAERQFTRGKVGAMVKWFHPKEPHAKAQRTQRKMRYEREVRFCPSISLPLRSLRLCVRLF